MPIALNVNYGIDLAPKGFELFCVHDIVADAMQTTTVINGYSNDWGESWSGMVPNMDDDKSSMAPLELASQPTNEAGAMSPAESGADDGADQSRRTISHPVRIAYASESILAEIPYWSVILPSTILSALLFFSHPRSRRMHVEAEACD